MPVFRVFQRRQDTRLRNVLFTLYINHLGNALLEAGNGRRCHIADRRDSLRNVVRRPVHAHRPWNAFDDLRRRRLAICRP